MAMRSLLVITLARATKPLKYLDFLEAVNRTAAPEYGSLSAFTEEVGTFYQRSSWDSRDTS